MLPLPGDELVARNRHRRILRIRLKMLAFILRRLAQAVLVMLAVGLIAFSLFRFVGDPVAVHARPGRDAGGPRAQ